MYRVLVWISGEKTIYLIVYEVLWQIKKIVSVVSRLDLLGCIHVVEVGFNQEEEFVIWLKS